MSIKNIWSLNVDECLVADKLKNNLKGWEVFFPLNGQLKDIDLVVVNLKNTKPVSIQVKGSRSYDPYQSEINRFGDGSATWFRLHSDSVAKPKNKLDYYVFVLHNFIDTNVKKKINIDYLIIPNNVFQKICLKKAIRKGGYYHFFIWIDSKGKRSFDFRESKTIDLSKYLNNWSLIK